MSWPVALLYAFVAVAAGSFWIALAYYVESASSFAVEERQASGFAFMYGLAVVGALPALVVYAVMLRWLARALGSVHVISWLVLGTALGVALPWGLAALGNAIELMYFRGELQWLKNAVMFPLMGPMMYGVQPVWVRLTVAGATALTLWLVVAVFARPR